MTTKTDNRPTWLINSRPLWSEDDAGTPDRERIGEAWRRLFGVDEPDHLNRAIDKYDAGDACFYQFPLGRIYIIACDGCEIRVENHVELQLQEIFELRVRPTLLNSLNDRGIRSLAQLEWARGEGHLDDLSIADQVHITKVLNEQKGRV